jgi:subtilisin family serine protease
MTIRDSLAKNFSGGPPFRIRADRILIEVNSDSNLTSIAQQGIDERPDVLDELPVDRQKLSRLQAEVRRLGFNVERLENLGVLVAETDRVADVVSNITDARDTFSNNVTEQLENVQTRAEKREPRTLIGAFKPGMNFGQEVDDELDLEAGLRGELISQTLQNPITSALREMEGVANVELSFTRNTFGPRNLNVDVDALTSFLDVFEENPDAESEELPTVADVRKRIGVPAAWENATGEGVIIAVLDTAFYRGFLEGNRVIDTFAGPDADNAYSDPEEGHGTMCAVSAAGNVNDGAPVNGVAPDAELLLARTTNSAGELVYIEEAWDWLIGHIKDTDKTVISSHSYGVPLCSGRTMDLCNATTTKLVRAANKREDHQAFYAAGNEALYCGHRLGGMTNGIMGPNSDPSSIAVGALRFDLRDAQNYSSHGFGTCSGINNNPKPDVSCMLSSLIPYGTEVKDMSTSRGGSAGGTSQATPFTAGVAALVSEITGNAKRSELESILESTARQPRPTQLNVVTGFDARFGHGQVRADDAVDEALSRVQMQ